MGSHAERIAMATRLVAKPLLNFNEIHALGILSNKGLRNPLTLFSFYVRAIGAKDLTTLCLTMNFALLADLLNLEFLSH